MKTILILTALLCVTFLGACGNKTATNASNSPTNTGSNKMTGTAPAPSGDSAASVVKKVYDEAIKRNCTAIPPLLTEYFRKEAGTTKDEMDALCDVFSDSGKITSVEVKDEPISGDSGKVKVIQNYKDGTKKDKEENVKKENGKWLVDN